MKTQKLKHGTVLTRRAWRRFFQSGMCSLLISAVPVSAEKVAEPPHGKNDTRAIGERVSEVNSLAGKDRLRAIYQLDNDLRIQGKTLSDGDRTSITNAVLKALDETRPEDPDRDAAQLQAAETLTAFGDNQRARAFVFKALEGHDQKLRDRVITNIGSRRSGIPLDDRWNKIEDLYRSGNLDIERRMFALRSIDLGRAVKIDRDVLHNTHDRVQFVRLAIPYQSRLTPEQFGELLRIIKERNLIQQPAEGFDGLRWMDNRALARYLDAAPEQDLGLAIEFVTATPCLPDFCLPVIEKRELLRRGDKVVRIALAGYIGGMAYSMDLKPDIAEHDLSEALMKESDEEVRTALRSALDRVAEIRKIRQERFKRR